MKGRGDCEGGRAPNIDQGASIAVRQRGACAKVERKARTRRDFSAFFARCAIAYRKFTFSGCFGSFGIDSRTLGHGQPHITRAYVRAHVRQFSIFAFTPSPACRNPHTYNAIRVKVLLAVPSPSPSLRHRWFGALFSVHCEPSGRGCDTRRTCAITFDNG